MARALWMALALALAMAMAMALVTAMAMALAMALAMAMAMALWMALALATNQQTKPQTKSFGLKLGWRFCWIAKKVEHMIRAAIDIELERPCSDPNAPDSVIQKEKIIQIGCVIFCDVTHRILKEVCWNINIGVPISSYIKELTGITQEEIDSGVSLEFALKNLQKILVRKSASKRILTWGALDLVCIGEEAEREGLEWRYKYSALNVKHLYQLSREFKGQSSRHGLKAAMELSGLKFEGSQHNALVDAKNTAKLFLNLKTKMIAGIGV